MHPVLGGLETKFVRFAPGHAAPNTTAGHPHREAVMIVIATVAVFGRRRATKLTTPDDERIVEQSALLEVVHQRGDRAIDRPAKVRNGFVVIGVRVPGLAVSVIDLHETHAAFDESASQQAAVGEVAFAVIIACLLRLLVQVERVAGSELHSEGRLHGSNAGLERLVVAVSLPGFDIELPQQSELPLLGFLIPFGISQVRDHLLRVDRRMIDVSSLAGRRQKRAVPEN